MKEIIISSLLTLRDGAPVGLAVDGLIVGLADGFAVEGLFVGL